MKTPAARRFDLPALHRKTRAIVAEDDAAMRHLLASALRRDDFEVIEARNGAELLHLMGALLFDRRDGVAIDLIVTDVRMPFLSGLDVLARVRRASWSMPVILITAFGDELTHDEARRLGASAILDKPFDVNVLRARARELVVD